MTSRFIYVRTCEIENIKYEILRKNELSEKIILDSVKCLDQPRQLFTVETKMMCYGSIDLLQTCGYACSTYIKDNVMIIVLELECNTTKELLEHLSKITKLLLH